MTFDIQPRTGLNFLFNQVLHLERVKKLPMTSDLQPRTGPSLLEIYVLTLIKDRNRILK